jgi:hypothetical protein
MSGPGAGQAVKEKDGTWSKNATHGTGTAGVAVGRPNSQAVGGVAPGAKLFGVNNFGNSPWANNMGIQKGLEYIYSKRSIYNFSAVFLSQGQELAKRKNYSDCSQEPGLSEISAAITKLKSVGIPVLVASGNTRNLGGVMAMACLPDAIAVGAVDDYGSVADYSNIGPKIDFLAPGCLPTSDYPGTVVTPCGTSGATPVVAGAITLLRQANPDMSMDDILAILKSTATPVSDVYVKNMPLINIGKALKMVNCKNLTPKIDSALVTSLNAGKYRITWQSSNNPRKIRVLLNSQLVATLDPDKTSYDFTSLGRSTPINIDIQAVDALDKTTSTIRRTLSPPVDTTSSTCTPTGKHLATSSPMLTNNQISYDKDKSMFHMTFSDLQSSSCLYVELISDSDPAGAFIFRNDSRGANNGYITFYVGSTFDINSKFVVRATSVKQNGDFSEVLEQWYSKVAYDLWHPGWVDPISYPSVSLNQEYQGVLQVTQLSKVTDFQKTIQLPVVVTCLGAYPKIDSASIENTTSQDAHVVWQVNEATKYVRVTVDNIDEYYFSNLHRIGSFYVPKRANSSEIPIRVEALDERRMVFSSKSFTIQFSDCSPIGTIKDNRIPNIVHALVYPNSQTINLSWFSDVPQCIYTEIVADADPSVAYVSRSKYGAAGHSLDYIKFPVGFNYSQGLTIRSVYVLDNGDFSLPMIRHYVNGLTNVYTGQIPTILNSNVVSPELMGIPQPVLLSDAQLASKLAETIVDYSSIPPSLSDELGVVSLAKAIAEAEAKAALAAKVEANAAAEAALAAKSTAEAEAKAALAAKVEANAAAEAALTAAVEADATTKAALDAKASAELEAKAAVEAFAQAQTLIAQLQASLLKKNMVTINCVKGKLTKKVTALKPVCPAGYKKK